MSPWIEEGALTLAVHVVRRFSENAGTGCLGAEKECFDPVIESVMECASGALLC
jgi:hypothetical protein